MESFRLFKQFIAGRSFYLLLPNYKIGSEHWITALLWSNLRDLNLHKIIIDSYDLPSQSHIYDIVIIDDALYTYNKIDDVIYTFSKISGMDNDTESGKHFHFHLLIPYVSRAGKKFIMDECHYRNTRLSFNDIHCMASLGDLIDISSYYPIEPEQTLRDRFDVSLNLDLPIADMPAIYFDHKVAAPESTFSSIYLEGKIPGDGYYGSLFRENPFREKIQQLEALCAFN